MPGSKILIIEDDKFLSSILKGRLEKEGFTVLQAFDGEEGYRAIQETKPDLILTDLIMPKVSGFEVLERISIDPQLNQIPIVILTNLGQDSDIQKAKALGARDYLVKVMVSIDQIVGRVKSVLVV